MKKYMYSIIILSIAGTLLCLVLMIQHYYPSSGLAAYACAGDFENSCQTLALSGYSTFLGIPVAAYGLFFYFMMIFTILIADYAGGDYLGFTVALLLPFSALSILIDAALSIVLVATKSFCLLCISSYAVNLSIFGIMFLWFKNMTGGSGMSYKDHVKKLFTLKEDNPDRKAAAGLFVLFVMVLFYSIYSTSVIMMIKGGDERIRAQKVESMVREFYKSEIKDLNLPDARLVLGNAGADVTIIAFTDFLCSACFNFFETEQYLLSKYGDKIRILYYHYPLDKGCNSYPTRTIYPNSCIAARAMETAARMGILEKYLLTHFENYKEIKSSYDSATSLSILKKTGLKGISEKKFTEMLNSDEILTAIESDIDLAGELVISGTPTLFIGGRRIGGSPPREMLDAVIKRELINKLKK